MSNYRHIVCLSGGKDSTALAVYMKDRVQEMEYVFCDTGKELPETYDYLNKIEAYLGKSIVRLNSEYSFDHWVEVFSGYLPSAQMRWCTKNLKLKPFERYVGDAPAYSYIGIRADEDRSGYISHKPNLIPRFPFKEDGITKEDVFRILEESGLSLPAYYEWRTRSGCYFCFFQRKAEWIGLMERHPDYFELAKSYEKVDPASGQRFTWTQRESLEELAARKDEIKANHAKALKRETALRPNRPLIELFDDAHEADSDGDEACLICDL